MEIEQSEQKKETNKQKQTRFCSHIDVTSNVSIVFDLKSNRKEKHWRKREWKANPFPPLAKNGKRQKALSNKKKNEKCDTKEKKKKIYALIIISFVLTISTRRSPSTRRSLTSALIRCICTSCRSRIARRSRRLFRIRAITFTSRSSCFQSQLFEFRLQVSLFCQSCSLFLDQSTDGRQPFQFRDLSPTSGLQGRP